MIGFTTIPQRNEITAQGLLTMDDLADHSKDELNAIFEENKFFNRGRDTFMELLNRKRGAMGIPLSYVGRTTHAGNYDDPQYATCVLYQEPKYEADVHDVYSLLCTKKYRTTSAS